MPEKISILKESGETLNSNVVSVFMIPDTEKRYIITTENAVDPHGLTVLHVSEIVDGMLQRIATDEEWSSIKTIMRAIISGNVGSYQYLPMIESIKANAQYSRDISVSASASKQMIDNYAAGDKKAVAQPVETMDATPASAPAVQETLSQPAPQPSSIFPTGGPTVSNDDELIPGIAEVSANAAVPAPETMTQSEVIVAEPTVIAPTNVIDPQPQQAPVVQPVVQPTMESIAPQTPVVEQPMTASNIQVSNNLMQNAVVQPSVVPEPVIDQNIGIQVAQPTQTVPTAQIVQEAQIPLTNDISFDVTAQPGFNPNATLDEVVMGAQEMFMEGVKNLVQTIQEKVYRDLYAKEAELKQREEMLEQREQLINNQMLAMMSSFGSQMNSQTPTQVAQPAQTVPMGVPPVSTVQSTTPVQSVVQPNVVGPTVVSAANDVI